jgi:hypothetical protein
MTGAQEMIDHFGKLTEQESEAPATIGFVKRFS